MPTGIELIAQERQKQLNELGYTKEHDSTHAQGELLEAAKAYLEPNSLVSTMSLYDLNDYDDEGIAELKKDAILYPAGWPFYTSEWHGNDDSRIVQLAKAGALIAAEIDRLQALEPQPEGKGTTTQNNQ